MLDVFAISNTANENFSDFYAGSWQSSDSPVPLLIIRFILAFIADTILLWCLVEWHPHWLLYLTNWGVVLLAAMHTSAVYVSYMAFAGHFTESNATDLPWYATLYWVLYNVTVPLTFLITFLYWLLLYDPDAYGDLQMIWLDVATHGITAILAFIELFFCRTPMYLEHVGQPVAVGLTYAVINAVYFIAGGTDRMGNRFIYEVLQFRDHPIMSTMVVAASTFTLVIIYLMVCVMAIARDFISYAIFRAA